MMQIDINEERAYLDGFIAAARCGRQAQHTELALLLAQLLHSQHHIAVALGSVALIHNQTDNLLVGADACTGMHTLLKQQAALVESMCSTEGVYTDVVFALHCIATNGSRKHALFCFMCSSKRGSKMCAFLCAAEKYEEGHADFGMCQGEV